MSMGIRLPDFDVLVALYQHEPEAFEAFRRYVLREAVDYAPPEQRPALEQLLHRIDETRDAAATPLEAAAAASRMMQESVNRLGDAWEQARQAAAELQTAILLERLRVERSG
jgi:hypothetical protein